MKKNSIIFNILSLGFFAQFFIFSDLLNANTDIQWKEVPGVPLNNDGESTILVGINTINRNGDLLTTRTKSWKRVKREGLIEISKNQSDPHASD